MSKTEEVGKIARNFLRENSVGVLATHSVDVEGYPFGSVTPYIVNHKGFPTILISTLAQHTRNIQANPKASLTIFSQDIDDVQSGARLTWIGDVEALPKDDEKTKQMYLRYFPNSKNNLQMHDFSFYQINLKRARFIGGFGQIAWVEPQTILLENPLSRVEDDIIDHMNIDHKSTMKDYCEGLKRIIASDVHMLGIDSEGFDVLANNKKIRFAFEKPIVTAEDARAALVLLARKARAYLPTMSLPELPPPS
jgi:putative heme iron utilization protein